VLIAIEEETQRQVGRWKTPPSSKIEETKNSFNADFLVNGVKINLVETPLKLLFPNLRHKKTGAVSKDYKTASDTG